MRVLAITKVFPNAIVPLDEPHIRQQYSALGRLCEVEVLASIPWFPGISKLGRYSHAGRVAGAPVHEVIDGLSVHHPRFLQIPKLGLSLQGLFYAASLLPQALRRRGRFDVIFATWAYPDGVAAVALGRAMGVPVVVEVIGSDINVVAQRPAARANLQLVLPHAGGVVAVSRQLAREVVALGVAEEKVSVIPTGVNPELFQLRQREQCRRELGIEHHHPLLLYLGRIEKPKGVFDLLDAFNQVLQDQPNAHLVMVGAGSALGSLREQASALSPNIQVIGQRPLKEVPLWLGACDVMTLPSWAEGTPNVILEALACGRRVVASKVGGIPDVVRGPTQGELVEARDVQALAAALGRALAEPYDPEVVAASEGVLTLAENAEKLHDVLRRVHGG